MKKCKYGHKGQCCCNCDCQYKLYTIEDLSKQIGWICLLQGEFAVINKEHGCCECWGEKEK
jgi:hypothetical protein